MVSLLDIYFMLFEHSTSNLVFLFRKMKVLIEVYKLSPLDGKRSEGVNRVGSRWRNIGNRYESDTKLSARKWVSNLIVDT